MSHDPITDAADNAPNAENQATNTTTTQGDTSSSNSWSTPTHDDDLMSQISSLREQLARAQADYANMVRRNREESAQISEWIENKMTTRFLPTLDNLQRSLLHIPEELKSHAWMQGFTSIVRAMEKTIADLGVTPMDAVGTEVNPDLHEVISQVPDPATTILTEVEKWYTRNGKALRHAKVIVGDGTGE